MLPSISNHSHLGIAAWKLFLVPFMDVKIAKGYVSSSLGGLLEMCKVIFLNKP